MRPPELNVRTGGRQAAASETLVPGVRRFAMASGEAVRYIVAADETARARVAAGRRSVRSAAGSKRRPPEDAPVDGRRMD